ncbi:hypothetical protein MXB_1997 [Myxobolus squamalis]|nr:hypothetical protein MXB_1997 [Myxobolus squamalis]
MILTICQFMSSEIKIFDNEHISLNILRRMIAHPGVAIKRDFVENYFLYKTGVPVDYYILIIEGRVEVTIGSEKLTFVQGPLSYYGHLFLEKVEVLSSRSVSEKQKTSFIPDFSLRITTDVVFLKINYSLYKIAVEATKLENTRKQSGEKTDDIWDKIAPNAPLLSDTPLPSTPNHQPDIIIISNEIKPTP